MQINGDYEALAVAIVRLTALDYLKAKRYNIAHPVPRSDAEMAQFQKNLKIISECLDYFRSSLFELSMESDPERIISLLDEKAASGDAVPLVWP